MRSEEEYIYADEMFTYYEQGFQKDDVRYEYRRYEADGFNIGTPGWRETLEKFAQEKLAKLKQQHPTWEPFLVVRDRILGTGAQPELMRPLAFGFRRVKQDVSVSAS